MSTRHKALEILNRIEREDAWATPLIEAAPLDDRDRRFVRTIVFAVLRWRSQLDFLIGSLASRPAAKIDPPLRQILRLGLAQILHTDVSAHAAVNETVNLCTGKLARGRGMVNAVLRRAVRERLIDLLPGDRSSTSIAIRTGHPEWLIARWADHFGESRAEQIAQANQDLSRSDLIVNTLATTSERLRAEIEAAGGELVGSDWFADVFRTTGSPDTHAAAVTEGRAYPMDEASVAVARSFSRPLSNSRVLDVAAAPGGKSIVMTLDGASVISSDLSFTRLLALRSSFQRLFGRDPIVLASDGSAPALRQASFPWVLLDAPCSATGIIRRNPEIRWRLAEEDLESFSRLQKQLLSQALSVATEEVVYSTCSLEREENEDVVDSVLASTGEWRIDPITPANAALARWSDGRCLRITPESGADGFTIHRLRRQ